MRKNKMKLNAFTKIRVKIPKGFYPVSYQLKTEGKETIMEIECHDEGFRLLVEKLLKKYSNNT